MSGVDETLVKFRRLMDERQIAIDALCAIVARHPESKRGEHPAVDIAADALARIRGYSGSVVSVDENDEVFLTPPDVTRLAQS